jgi:hypothetical protein
VFRRPDSAAYLADEFRSTDIGQKTSSDFPTT